MMYCQFLLFADTLFFSSSQLFVFINLMMTYYQLDDESTAAAAAHTNLGLSAFSASQTTMNKMRNGLQGHASVATIQGNPGGQQN